jgi:hypothetical protein
MELISLDSPVLRGFAHLSQTNREAARLKWLPAAAQWKAANWSLVVKTRDTDSG